MIFDRKIYGISCDACRKILSDPKGIPLQFDLNLQAITAARNAGWTIGDKDLCPDCSTKKTNI